MKIKKSVIATLSFLIIFFVTYYIHISFLRVNVVFYSAIFDGIVATCILAISLYMMPYFNVFNVFEKIQFLMIMLLISYALSISIPTVIDRSLSFYILEKIQQNGGGVRLTSMEDIFTKEYMVEHRLIDIRITEQLESGTIKVLDNCVLLTERGKMLSTFSRFFRKNFLPKHRLIDGKYTDDLVDPFSKGMANYGFQCKQPS